MRDLAPTHVARAVALIESGQTYRPVARALGASKSTINRNVLRYRATGSYDRRRGQGRKRSTTVRDDRFIVLQTLRNRSQTAVQTRSALEEVRGVQISERTVRRRLKEVELGSYVPAKVPKLEVRPRVARLAFGREHENWNIDQWSQVLFTDESRFCVNTIYGRERIWRRRGERYSQCNFTPKVPFGGGSIMIWGRIGLGARTELVIVDMGTLNADRYITNFLQDHVVPFAPHIGDNFILMQDNARPHIARCVTNFITETEITKMDWPARSPDMNPIEHVWDMLGKRVKARIPAPQTTQALQTMLLEEWDNLPQELIDNSIRSMPRRMIALIRARGGNTRY
jgi:transposase